MENQSTINTSTDANFQALVLDDKTQVSRQDGWHIIGHSPAFIEVMKELSRIAGTNSPVLLTGESGIVKELAASAIHNRSNRRDQPFVTVNCASIPAESIEAELFGRNGRGLFGDADGGTIYLKEITETTPTFQEKLLRFLQTGEVTGVDSTDVQAVNVRLLLASSRNVAQEVAAGRLCKDLFDCLTAVSIDLPPLRERPEDIPANDDWVSLSVIEGRYVARVLEHTHGNKQAAARVLAVDRKTLDRMIKRHHIDSHQLKASHARSVVPT